MALTRWAQALSAGAMLMAVTAGSAADPQLDFRGRQFIGFDDFSRFARAAGPTAGQFVLTSPVLTTRIRFNQLVLSWNVDLPTNSALTVEARALYAQGPTKYYNLGLWANGPAQRTSQSQPGQKDAHGDVATDTLILEQPTDRLQVRLSLPTGGQSPEPIPKFLGICLADSTATPAPLPPRRHAWGKPLEVPERTQMIYPNGKELCSPTTVSMLLGFWALQLHQPQLDQPVPEIARAIYDAQWHGTGNWSFNMAYAGSLPHLRAYVSRFSDVAELEAWIEQGIPVGLSLDYDRLRAKGPGPNGHLVVLVGFTQQGDPILNDPGTSQHVRKTFPRQNLVDAWSCSRNTVYLVYPETMSPPADTFGHWDSPLTRNPVATRD